MIEVARRAEWELAPAAGDGINHVKPVHGGLLDADTAALEMPAAQNVRSDAVLLGCGSGMCRVKVIAAALGAFPL
jgi:hypothetical protein